MFKMMANYNMCIYVYYTWGGGGKRKLGYAPKATHQNRAQNGPKIGAPHTAHQNRAQKRRTAHQNEPKKAHRAPKSAPKSAHHTPRTKIQPKNGAPRTKSEPKNDAPCTEKSSTQGTVHANEVYNRVPYTVSLKTTHRWHLVPRPPPDPWKIF